MKKTIYTVLTFCLLLGLCACQQPDTDLPTDRTEAVTDGQTTAVQTGEKTEAPDGPEHGDLQLSINQTYTDADNYLKDAWEKQQASGLNAAECSVIVPVLKNSTFRFDSVKDHGDRITYTFKSAHASVAGQTVRVCVSLRPNTFEEFTDNYASRTEDGAVYCWNENMNIWAFDIEDDIDGNFLYVEFPVSEKPTPLSAVQELFEFELRTYSPENNAAQ